MNPWPGLALVVVVAVIGFLWFKRAAQGGAERLLKRAAGAEAAERLIRFELSRNPGMARADAARRAYDRLIADRTR